MNNAGIGLRGTSWEGMENWHKVFDVNLFGWVVAAVTLPDIIIVVTSVVNVQHTFVPVSDSILFFDQGWGNLGDNNKSMIHQENQAMIINTGSKQGITNPPYVSFLFLLSRMT